jgi:hypothetical protein
MTLEQTRSIETAADSFNRKQHNRPSIETSFIEGVYWAIEHMDLFQNK